MANKREFKKYVNALGASIANEIACAYDCVESADREALQAAFGKVLGAVGSSKSKANIFFDRGHKAFSSMEEYSKSKRAFFKSLFRKIESDFDAEIKEALKTFNAALPESEKAANKAAVNN